VKDTWTGTITDATAGQGTITIIFDTPWGVLFVDAGTWSATFTLSGIAQQGDIVGDTQPTSMSSAGAFVATCSSGGSFSPYLTLSGNVLSGTYLTLYCAGLSSGTLNLKRQ
jgi:hypothetical protein